MNMDNQTSDTEFFIVGFSDFPQLKVPLFVAFLMVYLVTLGGNLIIFTLVCCNTQLHTPMYFFLTNLSFIDVTFTTTIFPKMLADFFAERPTFSLTECLVQLYFFMALVYGEFFLLTVMAYDRYVAICNPLRYSVIMSKALCSQLSAGAWVLAFLGPVPHTVMTSALSFCKSHLVNHFFCDITALMKISCTSTRRIETLSFITGTVVQVFSLLPIIISYIHIISAILKIQSVEGRSKAFSTCASHLTVVILFFGSLIIMYLRPPSMYSLNQNKVFALLYCAIVPLFNPIIYSLKNKELRNALRKIKMTIRK
ncbi:olfactory receptor 8D1-like [Ambystoma mexicanum]|uniref:olfactory receptor 8D1-like n=1 Tax=Ambystoma mexicanum TaxID=8296 RepID=UPI0037E7CE6A